jgi:hypothetical protein
VKLIRLENDRVRLVLDNYEKELLFSLLQLYPAVSAGRRKLTQHGGLPDQEASQALLEESLAETRAHHQKTITAWFTDAKHLNETEHETTIVLSLEEVEILLQVLNDIRIGSWIALGSPEKGLPRLSAENAPQLWTMQLSDAFLMDLLEGLQAND